MLFVNIKFVAWLLYVSQARSYCIYVKDTNEILKKLNFLWNFYPFTQRYSLPLETSEAIREFLVICKYFEKWFLNISIESNKGYNISQILFIRTLSML